MESDGNGYENFCKVTGRNPDTLRSVLEFSLYLGFAGINLWAMDYPNTSNVRDVTPKSVADKLTAFEGPHHHTIIKAYLAKRHSWQGRLDAAWRKPCYLIGFFAVLAACCVRSMRHG